MDNHSKITWKKSLLILAGVIAFSYAVSVLWFVSSCPDMGLHCSFSPVIKRVDSRYLEGDSGADLPMPGDSLVQVGDFPVKQGERNLWAHILLFRALLSLRDAPIDGSPWLRTGPDGERQVLVQYKKSSEGATHVVWCRLGKLPTEELLPSILWFCLKLGLFMIGALVFWKRPGDASAAQFFVLCIITLGAYMGGYHWMRIASQPILLLIFMVCGVLLPAVSLHFYLVFPRPKTMLLGRPWPTLAAIYVPPLLFLVALALSYTHVRTLVRGGFPEEAIADAWSVLRYEIVSYMCVAALWYLACVVCLVHSYRTAADVTSTRR